MNINLEFVTADHPTVAFENAIQAAANILDAAITDNITINLQIGYGEVNGSPLSNGSAAAGPDLNGGVVSESYSSIRSDLINNRSPGDSSFDFLPSGSSIDGASTVDVYSSQQRLWGLLATNSAEIDGIAGFATDIQSNLLVGVALHELAHAIGRVPDGTANVMEFDRFTSQGNNLFNNSIPAQASYFSLNGGATKWADYGVSSDPSDFLNNALTPGDPFNEFYGSSTFQYLTPADLEQLDILGFHLADDAPVEDNHDFNGQNSGDILVQNSSGNIVYANMAGGSFQGWVNVGNTPGYAVVGEGHISGRTDADIVLRNSSGNIIYAEPAANGTSPVYVNVKTAPGFNVVGVGDINRDHYDDIVVQNPNTGVIDYANMQGGTFHNWVGVAAAPGYTVDAVADINGDGYADIVAQNSSGSIVYANMAGGTFQGWVGVTGTPGFSVVGAGDIARTGDMDIVVQNHSTGSIQYANMVNGQFHNWVNVGAAPGWNVVAVEDVTGNGYDDIVIQNSTSGALAYANMTDGTLQGWVGLPGAPGYTAGASPASSSSGAIAMDPGPTSSAGSLAMDPGPSVGSLVVDPGPSVGSIAMDPGPNVGSLAMDPGPTVGSLAVDPGPKVGSLAVDPGPTTPNVISGGNGSGLILPGWPVDSGPTPNVISSGSGLILPAWTLDPGPTPNSGGNGSGLIPPSWPVLGAPGGANDTFASGVSNFGAYPSLGAFGGSQTSDLGLADFASTSAWGGLAANLASHWQTATKMA